MKGSSNRIVAAGGTQVDPETNRVAVVVVRYSFFGRGRRVQGPPPASWEKGEAVQKERVCCPAMAKGDNSEAKPKS